MILSLSTKKVNLLSYKNERILLSVAVYGANTTSKSNLHKAMSVAIRMIRSSNNLQIDQPLLITPFLLDENSRNNKTKFEFIYVYNGIKYEYGFVLDTQYVWEEYLYEYRSLNIPWWRSHPIHENRATESICTEPCNPLLRATKSMKRATSTY